MPPQRIDILTTISGVEFDDAWPGRVIASIGEMPIPVIGLRHLLQNKLACGRDKELLDAKIIKKRLMP